MPDDLNVLTYLAFVWWLIKVCALVVSMSLNVIFLLLLLQLHTGF